MNITQSTHLNGTLSILSEKLRSLILNALPNSTENTSDDGNIFYVKKRICYLKEANGFITLGFYGNNKGMADELCYINISDSNQIKDNLYSTMLKSLAY